MNTGVALNSSFSLCVTDATSSPGTSRPGQPNHWKVVLLERPLNPVTRPPEDMENSYLPPSDRLTVIGRRFETIRRRELPDGETMDGMGVGRNPREISVGVDQRENDWVSSMYSSVEMEKKS